MRSLAILALVVPLLPAQDGTRARARDLGVAPGISPGRWTAISDVGGVRVGHATLVAGDSVRTVGSAAVRAASATAATGPVVEGERGDGSIMMIVATDAPLSDRLVVFSTAASVRRQQGRPGSLRTVPATLSTTELANDETSALYEGVVEAAEAAIYNALFVATKVSSRGRTVRAILARYDGAER